MRASPCCELIISGSQSSGTFWPHWASSKSSVLQESIQLANFEGKSASTAGGVEEALRNSSLSFDAVTISL